MTQASRDRFADVLLSDGTTVHLRQIRPEDAPAIVAMHARFSLRTRYLRYFSPYPRIPDRDLQRFVNVDHHDREAFVVLSGDRIVAVGRYERLGHGSPEAEVAFVVEDAYQGRGIGSVLLEYLAEAARQEGVSRFVAEVLPENGQMLRVFSDFGYRVRRRYADGVVHLSFPIEPTDQSLAVQWEREHRTEARSIGRLLRPRTVAVYGASGSGQGVGAAILGHLRDGGFRGTILPVHPSAETIAGLPAYRTAAAAGRPVDLAVVAVPRAEVPSVVADAAAAGTHALVVVSAGFAEAGPDGVRAQRELVRAAHVAGMRVVGPNCLGVINTDEEVRLNASLVPHMPAPGRIGFFSQSGALGRALLAEAQRRGLGLSTFVSAGNRADVSGNDLLQYWQDDPRTDVILLYLQTFGNPRKFARLARRIVRSKPIVVLASLSRPPDVDGAPGPDAAAVSALFAQSGVIRVDTVGELFDVGALLSTQPLPAGRRTAVVGNSSALAWLASAACRSYGLQPADGSPTVVPPQSGPTEFAAALREAGTDDRVDAVVAVFTSLLPGHGEEDAEYAAALSEVAGTGDKPIVAVFLGERAPHGVPSYPTVEEAVRALARVAAYADWLRQPPGTVPELPEVDEAVARRTLAGGGPGSTEAMLSAYGISVVPSRPADSAVAAVAAAERIGYPVALKAAGEGWRHRFDLGAVRLDLASADAVRTAYEEVQARFGSTVLVQPMVAPGVACVVEVVEDPAFGPVVGFGLGGVATELLGDRAWRPAPLTDRDAEALVDEPRAAPLLRGYRGSAPVDRKALVDLLIRVGRLVADQPRVRAVSLNPVLVRPDGLSVLHATVEIGPEAIRPDTGPRRL
ncbi:MAG TPA: GNAT family N-acetyltransferase [Micromonosporaceae bacterium]